MENVRQRLRASKIEGEEGELKDGRAAGEEWARDVASHSELENLATALKDPDLFRGAPDHLGWAGILYRITNPRKADGFDREDIAAFCEETGNDAPTVHWVRGFCDGAMEVFEAVRDQV